MNCQMLWSTKNSTRVGEQGKSSMEISPGKKEMQTILS